MDSVFASALRVSVSGAALTLLLLLLKPLLKNRVPKAISYYIWILVLLRLALPFGYSVNLPELPQLVPSTGAPAGAEPAVPDGRLPEIVPESGRAGESGHADAGNTTLGGSAGAPDTIGTRAGLWKTLRRNLALVWLSGALLSLGWHAAAYAVFYRKLARSFAPPHAEDLAVFQAINKDERIRLVCSGQTDTPMLVGILHPHVVLPRLAYVKNGMKPELCGILRHELTHLRHLDPLWSFCRAAAVTVYWWNPFVWLAAFVSGRDAELACDEAVAAKLSPAQRVAYARAILAQAPRKAAALSLAGPPVKERIVFLTRKQRTSVLCVVLALLLTVTATGCSFAELTARGDDPEAAPREALKCGL